MDRSSISEPIETHKPCEDCGSSDALALYDDGHTHCFSCGKTKGGRMADSDNDDGVAADEPKVTLPKGMVVRLNERSISKEVCQAYNVSSLVVNDEVTKHYYPYYSGANSVTPQAVKTRSTKEKAFTWTGTTKGLSLFGQNLFNSGGKFVTITEGELDCLSVFQMLGCGNRYPVVSIRNGAGGAVKECKEQFEWLNSFGTIVLAFDSDEPGREATEKVAALFQPSKVKVMRLREKDPNEYLKKGLVKEFSNDWWEAERYTPAGIVCSSSLWDTVSSKPNVHCVPYPWEGLNDLTYGMRTGELITITSGSGMGKTQLVRELTHHLLKSTESNIGMLMLEETLRDTGLGLMSIEANKPLHLPDTVVTPDEMRIYFDATLGSGRVYLFNHFGSSAVDTIVDKIRFLVQGCDCKFVVLDHISIIVSDQQNGDERKALDEIATKLKSITVEQDICLIMISHLKRSSSSKPHEEGGQTSLSDLRGTAGIGQLSNMVFGLERDGQAEDPIVRNTTQVRVLKNRFSGMTGPACKLQYDKTTGRLEEIGVEVTNQFENAPTEDKGV